MRSALSAASLPLHRRPAALVAAAVAIAAAVGLGNHLAFQLSRAGQPSFALWAVLPTVVTAALAVAVGRREGRLSTWMSVRGGDFTRGFLACALLFLGAWALTKAALPVGSPRESWLARLYLQLGDPSTLRAHVSAVVLVLVVLAVAEELVWRGFVTHLLEGVLGSARAWVWAAVLYALAQVPTVWALSDPEAGPNPVVLVGALASGLVWGVLARKYGRLLPGVFSHVLFDWTVLMMFRLWGPSV